MGFSRDCVNQHANGVPMKAIDYAASNAFVEMIPVVSLVRAGKSSHSSYLTPLANIYQEHVTTWDDLTHSLLRKYISKLL